MGDGVGDLNFRPLDRDQDRGYMLKPAILFW